VCVCESFCVDSVTIYHKSEISSIPLRTTDLQASDPHQNLRLRVPYSLGIAMVASNATSVMPGNAKRRDSPLVRTRREAPSIRNAARFVYTLNAATAVENIQANEPYKRTTPG